MPFQTRFTIRGLVIHNISTISGFPEGDIEDGDRLRYDLLMTAAQRGALAPGFQKIARSFVPGAIVRRSKCAELNTVGDAVKLVREAAGKPPTDALVASRDYLTVSFR